MLMGRTMKIEPSDTPIRHHDEPGRPPRDERRPPPPSRDRDFGRDRGGGWDRERERGYPPSRDREYRDSRDRDYERDREYGRDRRDRDRDFDRERPGRFRDEPPHMSHPKNDPERPTSLFIGNLDDATTDDDMLRIFGSAGKIRTVRLLHDRTTGRFRGCGFIDFERSEDAVRGMAMNGVLLHGRLIRVDFSQPDMKSRGDRGVEPRGGDRDRDRDREFRDRDRDYDRPRERDRPRDRSFSPPRRGDPRGDPRGPPPPSRGYAPSAPAVPAVPQMGLEAFAQMAQVPGFLQMFGSQLNPQAALAATAALAAQQQQQQQSSNDLSSLLRNLSAPAAPAPPQDPNMAFLQALMAGGAAAQPIAPRSQYDAPNPAMFSAFSSQPQQSTPAYAPSSYGAPHADDYRRPKSNPANQPLSKRPPGCRSVFVASLPDATTDADIHALFDQCGKIEGIRWLNERGTGRFRGCGFVDFADEVAPVKAVNFNGAIIHGSAIRVDYALPKEHQ
jgi:RNA recognition motif-containing protein